MAVYEKGPKVLLQGKGIEEFVQFELEPKILGEAKLGYEEVHSPEMFEPHFGVDESGKGDFFGPLVIAGRVCRSWNRSQIPRCRRSQDSKRIGSDARIRALADTIRKSGLGLVETVLIGPAKYNELYGKFGNLNSLLGWGHARVIENLLAKKPDCPRSLSDQFADARVIEQSLLKHGRKIEIQQRTKGGIGHRGRGGVDPGARGVHQLAGAEREGAWVWSGARRFDGGERDGAENCRHARRRKPCGRWRKCIFARPTRSRQTISPSLHRGWNGGNSIAG